jgi:hypothetical protein
MEVNDSFHVPAALTAGAPRHAIFSTLLSLHPSGPNILLSTLFSNILNLCSSFNVRDQDSDPYKSKKKSKAVPLHAMEAHWGKGGIAPTHT